MLCPEKILGIKGGHITGVESIVNSNRFEDDVARENLHCYGLGNNRCPLTGGQHPRIGAGRRTVTCHLDRCAERPNLFYRAARWNHGTANFGNILQVAALTHPFSHIAYEDALALGSNVDPAADAITVLLPGDLNTDDTYFLEFVSVSDNGDVISTSAGFTILPADQN